MTSKLNRQFQKPIGVWILTISIFIRFGIVQFFDHFFNFRESETQVPLLIVIILLSLSAFTAITAIWALTGDNLGRITLLFFVSLNIVWIVFSTIIFISYKEQDDSSSILNIGLVQPLIWLILCWWYFTKKNVIDYYHHEV